MNLTARQRRIIDPIREADTPPFPVRKFTVAEYHRLLETGILSEHDPYELLRGWIVPKPELSRRQVSVRNRLLRRMFNVLDGTAWLCGVNEAITFRDSEAEPSLLVCLGPAKERKKRHPDASETEFVVEVAGETLELAERIKSSIYASGRVPVYWIVDLMHREIDVLTGPRSRTAHPFYRYRTNYRSHDAVPVVLGGEEVDRISVRWLLP